MKRVKICGITSLEDAQNSINSGADALGFVFYEPSPRYVTPQSAKEIIENLPPFVEKVGLFVNATSEQINSTCKEVGITLAQIHFEVDEQFLDSLEVPYIVVVRASKKEDIQKFSDKYRIVDAFVDDFGGVGVRIDLAWFEGVDCTKIILAGGLKSAYLEELKSFNFYGYDVSSGVEKSKGIKDALLVKEFVRVAKS